jgi:hypothetical protein
MAEDKKKNDRVSAVMGGKKSDKKEDKKPAKKKGGKKTKGMHVRKADSGGYVVKHDAPEGEAVGEEHVMPDMAALQSHISERLEGEEAPQGASPAPTPAVV